MLQALVWFAAGVWAVMLVQVLLNRFLIPDLERVTPPEREDWPLVSILVPARNEEAGIETAVTSFCEQDYPALEVIVVDDGSSDATPVILARLAARFPCLRVLRAGSPPPGWLGKPHALETALRQARGEWILAVDADVVYAPGLVRRAVALAEQEDAAMVVPGPRLLTGGVLEATVMSSLLVIGLGLLPLYLVSRSRWRRLAFGAGTGNLVRRPVAAAAGAFASIRDEVVDDVALGLAVKAAGGRIVIAGARRLVTVRMYRGAREAVEGFTKNAYPGLRRLGGAAALPFVLGLGFVVSFLPYLAMGEGLLRGVVPGGALAALVLMHATMATVAVLFDQPLAITVLNPVREASWWLIQVRSLLRYRRKGLEWRGRRYPRRG